MKFYIPFGDWSEDGHGKYKLVLVEAPSIEGVKNAQKKILERYGEDFFSNFAQEYSSISNKIKNALIETGYTAKQYLDANDYMAIGDENTMQLEEAMRQWEEECGEKYNTLTAIIDIFIHLHNAFGANITVIKDYPTLGGGVRDNYFYTVGYGCFFE